MQKFVKPIHKEKDEEVKEYTAIDIIKAILLVLFLFVIVVGVLWLIVGGLFALCKIIYLVLFTL